MPADALIAIRLPMGIGLLVFLILIGGVTAYTASRFIARVSLIGAQNTRGAAHVANIERAVRQLWYGVSGFSAAPDPQALAAIVEETGQWAARIDENITAYANAPRSQEELEALSEFADNYRRYVQARPRWLELTDAGRTAEAANWRSQTILPAAAAMVRTLQQLVRLQRQSSHAIERQALAEAKSLRVMLIAGLAVALLVAVTVAAAITTHSSTGEAHVRHTGSTGLAGETVHP